MRSTPTTSGTRTASPRPWWPAGWPPTLKAQGQTIADRLDELARRHGLVATGQVSVRVHGPVADRRGHDAASARPHPTELLGDPVTEVTDLLPQTDAMRLRTDRARVVVRPSGTEPKLKCYLQVRAAVDPDADAAALADVRAAARRDLDALGAEISAALGISSRLTAPRGSARPKQSVADAAVGLTASPRRRSGPQRSSRPWVPSADMIVSTGPRRARSRSRTASCPAARPSMPARWSSAGPSQAISVVISEPQVRSRRADLAPSRRRRCSRCSGRPRRSAGTGSRPSTSGLTADTLLAVLVFEIRSVSSPAGGRRARPSGSRGASLKVRVSVPLVSSSVPSAYVQVGPDARKATSHSSWSISDSSQAIIVAGELGGSSDVPPLTSTEPKKVLHPAFIETLPSSKVRVTSLPSTSV